MNFLLLLLLALAMAVIQSMIGGTRLIFAFPAYLILGGAAMLSLLALRREGPAPSRWALGSTLALAGYVLWRAATSPIPFLAWPNLYMTGAILIVYLLVASHLIHPRERLWLIGGLMVIALAHLAVGFVQHIEAGNYHPLGLNRAEMSKRASGMLISGNHFAGYMETVAMMALALGFWSRGGAAARGLAFLIGLACLAGVVMSGSRGGYLSTAAGGVVLLLLSIRVAAFAGYKVYRIAGVALGIALIAGSAIVYGALQNELVRERVSRNIFEDIRVANWQATIEQAKVSPWLGTGAGTHLYYGRFFRQPRLQPDPVHAHGDYLEMLAEYGIIGLGLAGVFLFIHLGCGVKSLKEITQMRRRPGGLPRSNALALQIGALAGVATLMAHSVVDFNMHIPGNALLYAILFGILANPGTGRIMYPALFSGTSVGRLLLPVAGIAMIWFVVPKFEGVDLSERTRVALRDRQYREAIDLGKRAVQAEPQSYQSWFYLGEAHRILAAALPVPHLREKHLFEAIAAYQRGLKVFPHDGNLLVRMGQALDALGRQDEAEAVYLEAISWDPNLGILYDYYADHLHARGMTTEAVTVRQLGKALIANRSYEEAREKVRPFMEERIERLKGRVTRSGFLPEPP